MAKKEEVVETITDDKKEQLLSEALKQIEKQYGKGSIMKLGQEVIIYCGTGLLLTELSLIASFRPTMNSVHLLPDRRWFSEEVQTATWTGKVQMAGR